MNKYSIAAQAIVFITAVWGAVALAAMGLFNRLHNEVHAGIPAVGFVGSAWAVISFAFAALIWKAVNTTVEAEVAE